MKRFLEKITGFNYIHDLQFSYGYKIPFTKYAIFNEFYKKGLIKKRIQKITLCHNCTKTGVY